MLIKEIAVQIPQILQKHSIRVDVNKELSSLTLLFVKFSNFHSKMRQVCLNIQGVFLMVPPKMLKCGKPRLSEFTPM